MEQTNYGNAVYPQVSVVPDKEERKAIRKKYSRAALILLMNMLIFNLLGQGVLLIVCAILGGGFSGEAIFRGQEIILANEVLTTLFSILPPIISETAAILLGAKILKTDLKSLFVKKDGYSGGTVAKLAVLCLGLQFAAGILAAIIEMILNSFGLESYSPDLSATTSFGANLLLSFYACILGPILEELLYRGVLLQSMRKYNERFAIFLSALIFGLMHQNYQQFLLGFLLGIPLAVVTLKYDSIIPSVFTHIFVNTSGILSLYVMQYFCPEYYEASMTGDESALTAFDPGEMGIIIIIGLIRIGFAIAGLVVGIVCLVKGGHMKRPTPAGKSRGLPILLSSVPWWIVFVLYFFIGFIYQFI